LPCSTLSSVLARVTAKDDSVAPVALSLLAYGGAAKLR
jgi:hypothetical protein